MADLGGIPKNVSSLLQLGAEGADQVGAERQLKKKQEIAKQASQIALEGDPKRALAVLIESDPSFANKLANVTQTRANAKLQQTRIFNKKTGQTELGTFDPETGEVKNLGIPAGYSPSTRLDPRTGEIIQVLPGGTTNQVSGAPAGKKEEDQGLAPTSFNSFNPRQQKALTKFNESLDSETKVIRQQINELESIALSVDQAIENPIGNSQLGARVAKIFEQGRLTDEDVVRYTTRKDLPGKAKAALTSLTKGTYRPEDAAYLKDALNVYEESLTRAVTKQTLEQAKTFQRQFRSDRTIYEIAPLINGAIEIRPEELAAIEWLQENPSDPRADKVKLELQAKGLL